MRSKPLSYRRMYLLRDSAKPFRHKEQHSEEEKVNRTIVGYTTKEHLILDLDKSSNQHIVENLVSLLQHEYPEIGDCLISRSSHDGFHCIFDNRLSWKRIMQICGSLTGLNIVNKNFVKVRTFREDLTLRITSIDRGLEKSEAPIPKQILVKGILIIRPSLVDTHDMLCDPLEVYSEKADIAFSGIFEYLTCLSAFREIEPIPIR